MQFYEPSQEGGAPQLYLLSDSPETLDKEYSVGADQNIPGVCTDPETSFVEVCGLLSSPTFTLTATAGPDKLAPSCIDHGPLGQTGHGAPCAPIFYIKGEAGDDTLEALFHDARTSMDLDCGEGDDTVVNLNANDVVHHDCEHVPVGAHFVTDPEPSVEVPAGGGKDGGNKSGHGRIAVSPVVVDYAPELIFHPDEMRWPADPAAFLKHSSLKWKNGPHSCAKQDTVVIAAVGTVNAGKLSSGGYKYRSCTLHYTPRHPTTKTHATWNTRGLTAPSCSGNCAGGDYGFYLDLDNKYRKGTKPENNDGPPIYVEYKPRRYIVYWLFYNQNDARAPLGVFDDTHEGDWEHIVVRLNRSNEATAVAYYQHYCDGEVHKLPSVELIEGTHPRVFVAKGSHASYPSIGRTAVSCGNPKKGLWDTAEEDLIWDTWLDGSAGFRAADKEKWYGFGGGWGSDAGGDTWGPLGPGPLKLAGNALPKGW